jgi:hypothetical protein
VLLACVEPLDPSARGKELAAVALRLIRETFVATPGPAPDALLAAFAAANAALIAENRPLATGRWERQICVGATAIALTGREITVAQAPPSQAILVQDDQVYAFPDLASWRSDYRPDAPIGEIHPLGFAEHESPRLFQSEAAPGDIIALCATSVGRTLGLDDAAVLDLYDGAILTGDLEGSVDRLERLLEPHDIADAFAMVAAISRLSGPGRFLPRAARIGASTRRQSRLIAHHALSLPLASEPRRPLRTADEPAITGAPAVERAPLFEGLRDVAIDLAEIVASRRNTRAPAYQTRQRALAAPGALSVQRYRDSAGLPAEWRANLPRGPGVHLPARLLAVSLVLVVALSGTGIAVGRQHDREVRAQTALTAVDVALAAALEHPGTAMTSVGEAEAALRDARDAGASGSPLAQRQQNVASVRDSVWNVQRLSDVARIGALPPDLRGSSVRLALSGRTLYLVAGNLYELDPDQSRLVTLLSSGDTVEGGTAGDLRFVSIDGSHVIASDSSASYARDKTGRWHRRPLAVADVGGLRSDAPLIAWGDAAYGLSWDGDIVRFDQTSTGPMATIWAAAAETPDLESARDLAIDGRIHVLLADGRTLSFSHGALLGTLAPFVVPALNDVSFLAEAPFATSFYIVDRKANVGANAGRIVRVDSTGDARQYLTPLSTPGDPVSSVAARSLASAADVAVDELTGAIYWVSDGEIWRGSFPLA